MGQTCTPQPDGGGGGGGGGTGGGGTGGGGTGGGGGGTVALTIVKTDIDVRHDAGLECGNDLIAFGTSATTGVSYITPSGGPVTGLAVTNSENYDSSDFAVGNRTIFLAGHAGSGIAYQVSVFDVATGTILQTFPTTQIRLGRIPVTQDEPGNMRADGNYCVVICDQSTVTDGKILKVIDMTTGTPVVTSFSTNPASSHFQVNQVAVDAATQRVVAVANDTFYVYSIANPTAAPTEIPSANGINTTQIKISGNTIIALDDRSYPQAILVDLTSNTILALTDAEAINPPAIGGTLFAFFADATAADSSGGSQRAAVGTVPGPGSTKAATGQYIDGSTTNNGLVGFAGTMAARDDGSYLFLANSYLQYSTGSASFTVPADPQGTDTYGTPAWDVDCSQNTVGFKTAATRTQNTATKIGYIILP